MKRSLKIIGLIIFCTVFLIQGCSFLSKGYDITVINKSGYEGVHVDLDGKYFCILGIGESSTMSDVSAGSHTLVAYNLLGGSVGETFELTADFVWTIKKLD